MFCLISNRLKVLKPKTPSIKRQLKRKHVLKHTRGAPDKSSLKKSESLRDIYHERIRSFFLVTLFLGFWRFQFGRFEGDSSKRLDGISVACFSGDEFSDEKFRRFSVSESEVQMFERVEAKNLQASILEGREDSWVVSIEQKDLRN